MKHAKPALSVVGKRRLAELQEKYRPAPVRASQTLPVSEGLDAIAVTLCRDELAHAKVLFESYRWRDAEGEYSKVQRVAASILVSAPASQDAKQVLASATLGRAASLLNLQELDAAKPLVLQVSEVDLTERQKCALATALAQLDEQARARGVLDAMDAAARDEQYWKEASQLVDILGGDLPEVPERSGQVLNALAQQLLRVGRVGKAAVIAGDGLALPGLSPVVRASFIGAMIVALSRTLYDDDLSDEGIPVEDRRSYAERIDAVFRDVFSADLPESVQIELLGVGLNYAASTRERSLLRWIINNTDEALRQRVETPNGQRAFEHAKAGDVAKAVELLPRQPHPWRFELMHSQTLAIAGNIDEALRGLQVLADRWPGRAPIHSAAAELLAELRQFPAAAKHAARAFEGLPTDSMATFLGRCLVEARNGARALEILADRPTTKEVAEIRAYASDQALDSRAPVFWAELLNYDPDDTRARLGLALALARNGDSEGAARRARDLCRDLGRLDKDELAACGQILSSARFLAGTDDLIRAIADELRKRFPNDDTAEFQRLGLVAALGFPEGVAPIDYDLLSRAGHVKALSVDDAVEVIRQRRELATAAHALYRDGWLSAESWCELAGIRVADLVVRSLQASEAGHLVLRAPIHPGLAESTVALDGNTYLCSSLELLLLARCGVLSLVASRLGSGKLVTTDAVWRQMLEDSYFLEQSAQRDECAHLKRLLELASATPKIVRVDGDEAERVMASENNAEFVTLSAGDPNDVSAASLISRMAGAALISTDQLTRAAAHLGHPTLVEDDRARRIPSSLFLEQGLFELLHSADVLEPLLRSADRVVISTRSLALTSARLADLERLGAAAALQRELLQTLSDGRKAGWFLTVESPSLVPLPPFRDDVDRDRAELLTDSIRRLLPLKQLLVSNPSWSRICADSFGFDSLGHPDQWRTLAFSNEEGYAFIRKYWLRDEREVSVSRFVRAVLQGTDSKSAVRTLARMGFADVLLPDDVLAVLRDFGRVDTGEGARILAGVESSAGDALARGVFCRTQVAMVYALALWKWSAASTSPDLAAQFFDRLEALDLKFSTRLVEQTLCNLALCALDNREASFVPAANDMMVLDRNSVAGRMWCQLQRWQDGNDAREASSRRALAHAWETLGDLLDGSITQAQWAPLGLANDILVKDAGVNTDVPSPDAVVAVMSALWKQRPLRTKEVGFRSPSMETSMSLEDILTAAAKTIGRDPNCRSDGTSVTFQLVPPGGDSPATVSVPFEAALLRADSTTAANVASGLAVEVGTRDGRLHHALVEFCKTPDQKAIRKYLARAACNAPFRLVRDDPRFIFCFGDRATASQQGYPADLDELREMLSEPPTMFTGPLCGIAEQELPNEFARRLQDGVWSDRTDQFNLLHFASRVPGRLPVSAARHLLADTSDDDLLEVVAALKRSVTLSIGGAAMAAAFATLACFSDRDATLRKELASGLAGMLLTEFQKSTENSTLASVEANALGRVARVVSRLAAAGLSDVEYAWLTHRLYEWWVREVDVASIVELAQGESRERWNHVRTEVLLNVILDALEYGVLKLDHSTSVLDALVSPLIAIASQQGENPFEQAPRVPGWMYWSRPQGCGWLASSIAFWIRPDAFFELPPALRLAVLDKLPRTQGDAQQNGISFASSVRALSRAMPKLTSSEVEAVRGWVQAAESGPLLDLWRADFLTGLLSSQKDVAAAAQLRALAGAETVRAARAEVFAGYVEAVALSELTDLEVSVFEVAEAVSAETTEPLQRGLALTLGRPAAEKVRAILGRLVETPGAHDGSAVLAVFRDALQAS